jgi:hypothetical protein
MLQACIKKGVLRIARQANISPPSLSLLEAWTENGVQREAKRPLWNFK